MTIQDKPYLQIFTFLLVVISVVLLVGCSENDTLIEVNANRNLKSAVKTTQSQLNAATDIIILTNLQ